MKLTIILTILSVIMLIAGFFGGRTFENSRNGYHYKFLEGKEYQSELGPIEWSSFVESVGTPFALQPEMTMISMGNRTIYKAQRDFQENIPYAANIVTSNNFISWDDGDFHYLLKVDQLKNEKQTAPADQPIDSEINPSGAPIKKSP